MRSKGFELLEATYGSHKELILDRDSSIMPYSVSVICGNKYLSKQILKKAGFSVADGQEFTGEEISDALIFAQSLGFPVAIKPSFGSHGDHVYVGLDNMIEAKEAITSIINGIGNTKPFIVEEHFDGEEYRVFVNKTGHYAVLKRDPAHVVGSGSKSIKQLADEESFRRMNPRKNCLCPIALDDIVKIHLAKKGLTTAYVPKNLEKVYLRNTSNVAKGGVCEDYTDKVHASVIEISRRVLDVFPGLPYAGVDFLSKNIEISQSPELHRIIEVNTVPGIHMHMRPGIGQSRDVAKYLVDMIFPETKGE